MRRSIRLELDKGLDKGLDDTCWQDEIVGMRTGGAAVLTAMLVVQSTSLFGASYASYPNPVGEEIYRPHLLLQMVPIAVIVCAVLLGWLLHAMKRKGKRLAPDQAESPHG